MTGGHKEGTQEQIRKVHFVALMDIRHIQKHEYIPVNVRESNLKCLYTIEVLYTFTEEIHLLRKKRKKTSIICVSNLHSNRAISRVRLTRFEQR